MLHHFQCNAPRMEELPDGCQLDVLLLYEVVLDEVMEVMLPINTLRNLALLQVGGGGGCRHARSSSATQARCSLSKWLGSCCE